MDKRRDLLDRRRMLAKPVTYAAGHRIAPHWHPHAQFLFAVAGTMSVRTPRRAWIVPPSRALWIPARTEHQIDMSGEVEMRSVFIEERLAAAMPADCAVLEVTPLLRELIVRAATLPAAYDERGADGLLMKLMLAEIHRLPRCALDLPLPGSDDLRRLCTRLLADLSAGRDCAREAAALGMSARTLYRRFLAETGLTFARWLQQARLLESIRRLAAGTSVTRVALELGYESPSAFTAMFRRSLGVPPRVFLPGAQRD